MSDANEALLSLLGVTADDLVGQTIDSLQQHVDASALEQVVQLLDGDGALDAVPLRVQRADGAERDCLVSADRIAIDGAAHVFCIVRDITEQLAHDAALRLGYDALSAELAQSRRELDAAREGRARAEGSLQEFTRTVAHDLKSPLNAVTGFAGLLRERLLAGHVQEALGYTAHITRAAQRMGTMIDALSSLAQVSRQPLVRQPVDMKRMVQETWGLIVASHAERQVQLRLDELPAATADPNLVAQVWQNLLDNAWKYSAREAVATISVESHRDARGTWYRVTDNGAGFDMARGRVTVSALQAHAHQRPVRRHRRGPELGAAHHRPPWRRHPRAQRARRGHCGRIHAGRGALSPESESGEDVGIDGLNRAAGRTSRRYEIV